MTGLKLELIQDEEDEYGFRDNDDSESRVADTKDLLSMLESPLLRHRWV